MSEKLLTISKITQKWVYVLSGGNLVTLEGIYFLHKSFLHLIEILEYTEIVTNESQGY